MQFVFVLLLSTHIFVSSMHLILAPITRYMQPHSAVLSRWLLLRTAFASFLRVLPSSCIEMNLRLFRIRVTYAPKAKTRIFRFCFFVLPAPCNPFRSFP